jgi:polyhydroxyalkanoate synthesis repressor PhaR
MATATQPVLIKHYGNRRLYRPDAGAYVTLDDLAAMVEDDEDFAVRVAATGEDITFMILQQIIRKRAPHDEV